MRPEFELRDSIYDIQSQQNFEFSFDIVFCVYRVDASPASLPATRPGSIFAYMHV